MKKRLLLLLGFAVVAMLLVVAAGLFVYRTRGIPYVRVHDNWSVGIYVGETPFAFHQPDNIRNPVLTILDVTDARARFLADPFMVREGDTWYMFFEIFNWDTEHGDLSVATSKDLRKWKYERIVLDEPFHLAYPYVFKWEGEYYMIPDTYEARSVRLYQADEFPFRWSYVTTLLEGAEFVDSSVVFYNDKWWLFTSYVGNRTLSLYYADQLAGPWQEHPQSPIVEDNIDIARPGGRMLVHEGRLYRYGQDGYPRYGNLIRAFEITEISPTAYSERLVSETPVVEASGRGWNQDAMHTVDPTQLPDGQWVTPVDGSGPIRIFQPPARFGLDRLAFRLP
jgi:beta-xylosidase